jgi:hypothetical protein
MKFKEYDVVKVVSLLTDSRRIDGTESIMRQPQVGDVGTIVYVLDDSGDESKYIVESVDQDGMTVWLADFKHSELELQA